MACGLPVVIPDFPDNRQWVVESKNGYIVLTRCPEWIAGKKYLLLSDSELGLQMSRFNRKTIQERYELRSELARMECIHENIVEG